MKNRIPSVLALSVTILLAGAGYRHICTRNKGTVDAPILDLPDVLVIAPQHYGDISEGVFRIIEASEGLSVIIPSEYAISHTVIIKFDQSKFNLLKASSKGLVKLIGKWTGGQEEIVIPVKLIEP